MIAVEQLIDVDAFEEFIAQPENRHRLFELINGRIVEKVPTETYGEIAVNIIFALKLYMKTGQPGHLGMEVRHRPLQDDQNDRLPDVSVSFDPERPRVDEGAVLRMPDLAVEVKSPDDTYQDMLDAATYYLQNGCRMVWLVYPKKRLVDVITADGREPFTIDETITGGDVLPGFAMSVREIFEG